MKRLSQIAPWGIVALMVLVSCAGTPETRAVNALAIACDTYATALEQLTPRKTTLSATLVSRIDSANAKVKPVCTGTTDSDVANAITIVQNAVALINTVRGTM